MKLVILIVKAYFQNFLNISGIYKNSKTKSIFRAKLYPTTVLILLWGCFTFVY
nr:MAG TPA: hypothetical protein [Caudoviricetes sp.]